jgi:hypothetical protein
MDGVCISKCWMLWKQNAIIAFLSLRPSCIISMLKPLDAFETMFHLTPFDFKKLNCLNFIIICYEGIILKPSMSHLIVQMHVRKPWSHIDCFPVIFCLLFLTIWFVSGLYYLKSCSQFCRIYGHLSYWNSKWNKWNGRNTSYNVFCCFRTILCCMDYLAFLCCN